MPAHPRPALREGRDELGLTQQEVADGLARLAWQRDAKRVGVDANMVSKWERGESRPWAIYRRLLCSLLPGLRSATRSATCAR